MPGADGTAGADGSASQGAGNLSTTAGTVSVDRTILASPTSGDNCAGGFSSGGYNLAFPPVDTSCDASLSQPTDLLGLDPALGTATLNPPGTTLTAALGPASAAIDAIPPADCTEAHDQRGVPRPSGAGCEIGAFEVGEELVPITEIPTLGEWGRTILLLLLAAAGLEALRRLRPAT